MIAPLALTFLALAALQPAPADGGWIRNGEAVEWRAPGGGVGLRISCRAGGLELSGPAARDAVPSVPARVRFRHGDETVTLLAVPADSEDGVRFVLPVRASELPITTLLAGATLTIGDEDESVNVPGAGAPALLVPLVEACPSRN